MLLTMVMITVMMMMTLFLQDEIELRRLRTENRLLRQRIDLLENESSELADKLIQVDMMMTIMIIMIIKLKIMIMIMIMTVMIMVCDRVGGGKNHHHSFDKL